MSDSGGSPNVVSLDVPTPENEIVAASLRLEPTQLESPPGLTSPDTTQLDEGTPTPSQATTIPATSATPRKRPLSLMMRSIQKEAGRVIGPHSKRHGAGEA